MLEQWWDHQRKSILLPTLTFFTVLPPLALGVLDQFISARLLDRYPQLYSMGQRNEFFKLKVFVQWIANAIYHATGKRVRDLPITLDRLL